VCLNASSAQLSKWSSTTVSLRVDPTAVGRRLTPSTTFCIHGWSSGAGYVALNHWRPCSCRRRSTCLEQSSSRSAPIRDIFYFQNTPEVTYVQHILPFSLTVSLTILYRALEAACAACASLNLSLWHYMLIIRQPGRGFSCIVIVGCNWLQVSCAWVWSCGSSHLCFAEKVSHFFYLTSDLCTFLRSGCIDTCWL